MVAIVENWALIIGIVIGVVPVEPGGKFATLTVQVETVEPVQGFQMLVRQQKGEQLSVRVRPDQIAGADDLVGSRQSIRVRRGRDPDLVFAAHDWKAGDR